MMQAKMELEQAKLKKAAGILDSLSPLQVMSRGFSVVSLQGKTVSHVSQLTPGDVVSIRMTDGTTSARILPKEEKE